jgi:glycosyltransferase involved in cell wall biosynthesis
VLVPVHNRPDFVREALDSALAQQCPGGFEVLVVDDGSTDATPEALAAYGERIRVERQDNAGPAAARNLGIEAARGDLIALLDSDDVWLPGKLALQVAALDACPEAALSHTDVDEFFEDGSDQVWTRRPPVVSGSVLRDLLARNTIHTMTVVVRRDVVRGLGGFDARFPPCEDWDLWLRIAAGHEILGHAQRTVRTRVHSGGISADPRVVYRQAARLLQSASDRLAAEKRPSDARRARRQAARYLVKLGRRLVRDGRSADATEAFDAAIVLDGGARLAVATARLFPKRA